MNELDIIAMIKQSALKLVLMKSLLNIRKSGFVEYVKVATAHCNPKKQPALNHNDRNQR